MEDLDPNRRTLDQELKLSLRQINNQMEEIRKECVERHIPPVTLRDTSGNYIWTPLVVAKANVLHALTLRGVEVGVDDHQS